MKLQNKNSGFTVKILSLVVVTASIGLISAAVTYRQNVKAIEANERDAELNEKLWTASQYNNLLLDLENGKPDLVKKDLKSALFHNLHRIAELAPAAKSDQQASAERILTRIGHQVIASENLVAANEPVPNQTLANR